MLLHLPALSMFLFLFLCCFILYLIFSNISCCKLCVKKLVSWLFFFPTCLCYFNKWLQVKSFHINLNKMCTFSLLNTYRNIFKIWSLLLHIFLFCNYVYKNQTEMLKKKPFKKLRGTIDA